MILLSRIKRYPDVLGVVALSLLAVAVFWPLLLGGRALFFGDLELQFYPWGELWRRELWSGRLPFWNPYSFGGTSFAGNPQIGLLYPPSALLGVLPTISALMIGVVFHIWASGALFFLWLRRGRFGLGAWAALFGAMSWMLGGFFVSKMQFPNMLATLAWVPAVLWSAENLARRTTFRAAIVLGCTVGLQLLAAHAQLALYCIYIAFLVALWNWKTTPVRVPFFHLAALFGLALLVAACLDAGQLLPVLDNLRDVHRQALSLETAPRFFLPPWATSNLVAPYGYGNPHLGTWGGWGGGNFWETACYVGILPFVLAIWHFRRAKFWCALAIASVILAWGRMGGLYELAFRFLPGVSRFHDAGRFLVGAAIAFPVMAAMGLQLLRNGDRTRSFVPLVVLICALDLAIFARGVYPLRSQSQIAPRHRVAGGDPVLEAQQGRILGLDRRASVGVFVRYKDYRFRTPDHDARFARVTGVNTQIWHGILDAGGYDPMAPKSAIMRLQSLSPGPNATQFPPGYAALLGGDSVRTVSMWRTQPLRPTEGLTEIYRSPWRFEGRQFFIYRNEKWLPRARFRGEDDGWASARISSQNVNLLEIEVPQGAEQLELADNFSPSWSAFQNGEKIEVRATKRGFRAVNLKPSAQAARVHFVYAPTSFRLGVFISLCTLSFIVAALTTRKKPQTT